MAESNHTEAREGPSAACVHSPAPNSQESEPLHVVETALGIGRATAISLEIADNPSPVGLADNVAAAKAPFDAAIVAAREAFALLDALRQKLDDIEYGGRRLNKDGWRDDDGQEWYLWLGQMVECPRCAFMFGADHHDTSPTGADSYTCPNCRQDAMERTIRERLGDVLVSHGVGEMSELLAELLALVTGGASVGR
jgi:hypothetical protein